MSITSSSTLEEVTAQYADNLLWDGDMTKAKNELEAVRWLLVMRPESTMIRGLQFRFNYEMMQKEMERLVAYVNSQPSQSGRAMFTKARFRRE